MVVCCVLMDATVTAAVWLNTKMYAGCVFNLLFGVLMGASRLCGLQSVLHVVLCEILVDPSCC